MEAGRLPYLVGYAPLQARQWLRNGGRSGTGAAAAEANTTGLESWLSESSGSKFSHERVEEHQRGAGRAALPSIPAESASVNGRLLDTAWCRVQQAPGHPNHAHEEELSAVRDAADPVVFECPQSEHVPIFAFETEQLEAARAARLGQNSDWRKDPRSTARSIQCRRRQMTSWCISTTTTIAFIAGSSYKID